MTNLPPYSGPGPRCIKCGNTGAHTSYLSDLAGELLARQCDRCGYEWHEATIEQQPPSHLPYPSLCPGPGDPQP